jgi:hypothetical protein
MMPAAPLKFCFGKFNEALKRGREKWAAIFGSDRVSARRPLRWRRPTCYPGVPSGARATRAEIGMHRHAEASFHGEARQHRRVLAIAAKAPSNIVNVAPARQTRCASAPKPFDKIVLPAAT